MCIMNDNTVVINGRLIHDVDLHMVLVPDVNAWDDLLALAKCGNNALYVWIPHQELIEELAVPCPYRALGVIFRELHFLAKHSLAQCLISELRNNFVVAPRKRPAKLKLLFLIRSEPIPKPFQPFHLRRIEKVKGCLREKPDARFNNSEVRLITVWWWIPIQIKKIRKPG